MFEQNFNLQQIPDEYRNYDKLPEILKIIEDATEMTDPSTIQSQFCYLLVNGYIENGKINQDGCFQVKYTIDSNWNWEQIDGNKTDTSQQCICQCSSGTNITWNFPFQAAFKSKNICGWPRVVISIYGQNIMNQNVLIGYGSFQLPSIPGYHEETVFIYKPKYKSLTAQLKQYFFGDEIFEQKIFEQSLLTGENQEVSKMMTTGQVKVKIHINQRNFEKMGYQVI